MSTSPSTTRPWLDVECLCRALIALLVGLLSGLPGVGGAATSNDSVLALTATSPSRIALTSHLRLLEDPGHVLSVDEVSNTDRSGGFQQVESTRAAIGLGLTRSAWWMALTLRNDSDQALDRLLELAYSRYTEVQFHAPDATGTWHSVNTGILQPFDSRGIAHRHFVFPISLAPHAEQTVYLKLAAISSLTVPATLWSPEAFHRHERDDYAIQAAYFGFAAAMISFNALLFLALRDRLFLYYVGFAVCMNFTLATHLGLAKEYLPWDGPMWSRLSVHWGYSLAIAAMLIFMRRLLDTRALWIDRILIVLTAIHGVLLPLLYLGWQQATNAWAAPFGMVTMSVILGVGIHGALKGQRTAWFFVAALLALFFTAMLQQLIGLGLLPVLFDIGPAFQIACSVEMLLLAAGVADRLHRTIRDKERARDAAAKEREQLVTLLQTSERELESRVVERTQALESTLARLVQAQDSLMGSEQRAVQSERLAHQAMAEQRQFIAMVSHEFRSPLAVIDTAAQLLPTTIRQHGDVNAVLGRIRRGVSRLSTFIDNHLTDDRLNSERLALQRSVFELRPFLASVADGAQLLSEAHRIIVDQPVGPIQVHADSTLLRIALINLLGNAMKYSPPHTEVRLQWRVVPGGHEIDVIDQGCGIPPEEHGDIFRKYVRGRFVGSIPGAGLGLSLVARIAALHGGSVSLESAASGGTRFTVTLSDPAAEPHEPELNGDIA